MSDALIRGSESKTVTPYSVERMGERSQGELAEIEGSDHLVPLDKSEEFAATTLPFLER